MISSSKKYVFIYGSILVVSMFFLLYFNFGEFSSEYGDYFERYFSQRASKVGGELNLFFYEKINGISAVSNIDLIGDILKRELVPSEELTREEAIRQSEILTKEIENYLIFNREMTSEDLVNSTDLYDLGINLVGNKGYTAIYRRGDAFSIIHPNENISGRIISEEIVSPEFLSMIKKIQGGSSFEEGFYDLVVGEKPVRKYSVHRVIPIKTADNRTLVSISTIDYDDLLIVKNISEDEINFFKNLAKEKNYHSIFLLSKDGRLIFDLHGDSKLGFEAIQLGEGIYEAYKKVLETGYPSFVGPNYHESENHSSYVFTGITPVIREDEIIGYLGVIVENEVVYDLLEDNSGFVLGNEYLVNDKFLLSSPISNDETNLLIQEINSNNSRRCFLNERYSEIITDVNFFGEEVYGISKLIVIPNLCLLIEASKSERTSVIISGFESGLIIFFVLIVIIIISLYFMRILIDGKYSFKKSRVVNNFSGLIHKFDKIDSFRFFVVLFFIFVLYLFFLEFYMRGSFLGTINFLIFDVATVFAIFIVLKKSKKMKICFRKYIFIGGILIIAQKFLKIFWQQYEFYFNLGTVQSVWAVLVLMVLVGISFFISGMGGSKKC